MTSYRKVYPLARLAWLTVSWMLVAKIFLYFKLNSAFTCAVTVTACGVNSSVGAGVALAMADIARAMCGTTILGFSNVSTDA